MEILISLISYTPVDHLVNPYREINLGPQVGADVGSIGMTQSSAPIPVTCKIAAPLDKGRDREGLPQ